MTRVSGVLVAIIAAAVVGIGSNHPVSADPPSEPLPEQRTAAGARAGALPEVADAAAAGRRRREGGAGGA
jgi:hypothetical protein